MIIRSLTLKNIRSYREESLIFPEGSVMLAGDIGSGKSSILMALEFALFGLIKGSNSGPSLLRKGEEEGSVELCFEIEGKEYAIKRTLKKQKTGILQFSGFIEQSGRREEGTATELKAKILEIIGYPSEMISKSKSLIFRYTVYTPQEEMKKILFEDKDMRLDTLRKVFGVDKYQRMKENTEIVMRELKGRIKEREVLCLDFEEKKKRFEMEREKAIIAEEKERDIFQAVQKLAKEFELREEEMRQAERNKDALQAVQHSLQLLDEELRNKAVQNSAMLGKSELLKKEIAALEMKLPSYADVPLQDDALKAEMMDIDEKVVKLRERQILLQSEEKEILAQLKEIGERMSKIRENGKTMPEKRKLLAEAVSFLEKQKDVEHKEAELRKRKESVDEQLTRSMATVEQSERLIQKMMSMDTCPFCLQQVPHEHRSTISEVEQKKTESARQKIISARKEKEEIIQLLHALEEGKKGIQKAVAERARLETEIEKYLEEEEYLRLLFEKEESLKKRKDALKQEAEQVEAADLNGLLQKLESTKKRIALVTEKNHLRERILDKSKTLTEYEGEVSEIKKRIAEINKKKMELQKSLEGWKAIEEHVVRTKKSHAAAQEHLHQQKIFLAETRKEREGIASVVDILSKEVEMKGKEMRKIFQERELMQWMQEVFLPCISLMEQAVMMKIHHEFNGLFQKWFSMLVEGEMMNARLDHEFSPVIEQNGYETETENLSGGEKTALALAYRLSLNRVINDIISSIRTKDILILDEPTDGFSDLQLDKVRDVLEELAVKQVIMVSHESKLESFVQSVMRIGKSGHESSIVEE